MVRNDGEVAVDDGELLGDDGEMAGDDGELLDDDGDVIDHGDRGCFFCFLFLDYKVQLHMVTFNPYGVTIWLFISYFLF